MAKSRLICASATAGLFDFVSTTEIIATCAAVISCGLFLIQYVNQRERRHGELIQLKTQILSGQNAQRQRMATLLIQAETVRLELRRLPDLDPFKYPHIERFPGIIESYQQIIATLDDTIRKLERFDTAKRNSSRSLIQLQVIGADLPVLEGLTRKAEDDMIAVLESIRKESN